MANKTIFQLDEEVTPVATDEMEIQKTNDGDSFKATIANILNKVLGVLGIDKFKLNVNAGETAAQGELVWNEDEETADLGLGEATLQLGQEFHYHVRNTTGSTIVDGTPVMAIGTVGASGRILIGKMDGTDAANAKFFLGFTTQNIADSSDGKVTKDGKVRGLDLSAFNDGDVLYVSPTVVGEVVDVKPSQPSLCLPVAFVIDAVPSGTLMVRAQGIDENAYIFFNTTTTEGDMIVGDGSGFPSRLQIGTEGQVPTVSGDTLVYSTPAGGGDVTAAENVDAQTIVVGDDGAKGIKKTGITISIDDAVSGGKSLVVEKSDDYTLLAVNSGISFPQTGAAKTFSLPADTSEFSLGWFVTLYAPSGGVVTVAQLATADATILSDGDFLDIKAKGGAVLELVDDTVAAFVFRLSGSLG
jgi:hypothetical protein